ncbi:MAG: hypothetical protein IJ400_01495 [Clostridia bacterium]|nr:hypothetical protein [Clostridia bacterium]
MKKKKVYLIVIICGIVGALLLIFGQKFNKSDTTDSTITLDSYTEYMEEKIESFLLSVDGISNVRVVVTLEDSGEKLYSNQGSLLNEQSNTIVMETYPSIRGVAIACTNGDNDVVKTRITRLISAYLGISTNRIEIVSFG